MVRPGLDHRRPRHLQHLRHQQPRLSNSDQEGLTATLLAPGGTLVIEEFAWERVDAAAAAFHFDNRALLVATGLLDADAPAGDLLAAWVDGHRALHSGAAMVTALGRLGEVTAVGTSMLWRLVDGRGGRWIEPATRVPAALDALRSAEERRLSAGSLPAVGLLASVHP